MALGPSWTPLGASWAPPGDLLGRPEAAGGSLGGGRGKSCGPLWGVLKIRELKDAIWRGFWAIFGAVLGLSWALLGPLLAPLGPPGGTLEFSWSLFGPSGGLLKPTWDHLEAIVGVSKQ